MAQRDGEKKAEAVEDDFQSTQMPSSTVAPAYISQVLATLHLSVAIGAIALINFLSFCVEYQSAQRLPLLCSHCSNVLILGIFRDAPTSSYVVVVLGCCPSFAQLPSCLFCNNSFSPFIERLYCRKHIQLHFDRIFPQAPFIHSTALILMPFAEILRAVRSIISTCFASKDCWARIPTLVSDPKNE